MVSQSLVLLNQAALYKFISNLLQKLQTFIFHKFIVPPNPAHQVKPFWVDFLFTPEPLASSSICVICRAIFLGINDAMAHRSPPRARRSTPVTTSIEAHPWLYTTNDAVWEDIHDGRLPSKASCIVQSPSPTRTCAHPHAQLGNASAMLDAPMPPSKQAPACQPPTIGVVPHYYLLPTAAHVPRLTEPAPCYPESCKATHSALLLRDTHLIGRCSPSPSSSPEPEHVQVSRYNSSLAPHLFDIMCARDLIIDFLARPENC